MANKTAGIKTVVTASTAGTAFEWYDFFLYVPMAGIMTRVFFSALDPTSGYILALLSFAVGFAFRPVGALIFGRIGDRIGRKATFLVTMGLMGAATFAIGFVPSYAQIGIAAPLIFVGLRILQGLALGGEWGGAAIYIVEHVEADKRGAMSSWLGCSAAFGLGAALLVVLITRNVVGKEFFNNGWGWRIPFMFSAVLLAISMWIRLRLHESPIFAKMRDEGRRSEKPLAESFLNWPNLKRVLLALFGIMLARPAASLIADLVSWRAVFLISSGLMLGVAAVLSRLLPLRKPDQGLSYGALMASMAQLMARTPTLGRRALYQASMFGAFSVFWTATPLLLTGPRYGLSQTGVALFALFGAAGAISAPLTGRWADKGLTRVGSALAMAAASAAFLLSRLAPDHSFAGIALLAISGVVLDFAVTANLVFGQRAIYVLGAHTRARMNGLYMATFFVGGAVASALAGWSYAQGGWAWTSLLGAALPLMALAYFASEPKA